MEKNKHINEVLTNRYIALNYRYYALMIIVAIFVFGLIIYFVNENSNLRAKLENHTMIIKDNLVYEAVATEVITEELIQGSVRTGLSNMFNHNQYNLEERLRLAKPFFSKIAFNYLLTKFNESGDLKEKYITYDGQMELTISKIEIDKEDKRVYVTGTQRFVFADTEPVVGKLKLRLKLAKRNKSKKNPFGIIIDEVNSF